ncbi:hypothetical protein [Mucilaginibacter ginsenosidivorans]|uniref:Uncharacterized protein n=1 Tax=Mucilaginibacter ginsenosidivorans TaxID=398053 RepID=A0A5B8V1X1_9SPHI|nr:hypothetical protein [Mucilaginibacter ginsenosidivorans]QEC65168.1 hypothetical protein FRZ54_22210 [Mucilaginibacter ginsenosidivorans]
MKYLIALIFLVPFIGYSQTCIVAIKRNDTIMVGADSRVSQSGINIITKQPITRYADTSCKIISNGNGSINFSLSGYQGVSLRNLAKRIIDTAKSITAFEKAYQTSVIDYVFNSFVSANKHEVQYLLKRYKVGYAITDCVVFGREQDTMILHYLALRRKVTDTLSIDLEWGRQDKVDSVAFGEWKEISDNHLWSNREVWKNGLKSGIEFLINFSHTYHPDHVGGPINVLMVTRKKTMWLDKKPPCY